MFRRKTSRRRREFLLDSNQNPSRRPRKLRNRALNFLTRLLLLRHIARIFRASVLGGAVLVSMTLFVLFALFSPYFNLKKISVVRDNPNLNVQEIEKSLEEFYGENLLFLSHEKLKTKLWEEFPEFREIDITENWPSSIEFKVTLSPPFFNLLNTETANFTVVSEDGVILQKTPNESLETIKVFQYEKPIQVRQKFLSREDLQHILEAQELLTSQTELPTKEIHLYWASHELHLISQNNMALWLDLTQDIEDQIKKLTLSADEIGLYTRVFEHIDLRIPKQIFWKYQY